MRIEGEGEKSNQEDRSEAYISPGKGDRS